MAHFLGLDIGTSSTKVVLLDEHGTVLATALSEYPFATPRPLWSEADPADWWEATITGIREVLARSGTAPADVAAVGLSGQMHGLVMLDAAGNVLRPAILWNDQRTGAQCAELTRRVGAARVLQLTGNPILAGFTAPKILWVQQNEPEIYARSAKVLLPKDYVRYCLSGTYATDVSDASGMSLLDVVKRTWSEEMVDGLGMPRHWLAEVAESPVVSAAVSPEAARLTGLLAGTPIVAGAGDQAAQAVGCGIVREGLFSATFGTSGVVFAHSDTCQVEPQGRLHAFCHAVPGKWHLMGVMLSAAGSLQWYRNALGSEEQELARQAGADAYDLLTADAATVAPGAEGLVFLPYLTGERTPHPDPLARGAFVGLTLRHTKAHLTRAVLEGVTFGMNDCVGLMRDLGLRPANLVASGGGARSPFWRQMMADVFGVTITTVNATEGAALGAAVLAAVGAGAFPSVEVACAALVRETDRIEPGPDAPRYTRPYANYRALYPALKDTFAKLADG